MWKFIKYEWKYWLKTPMIWIFFFINALIVMGAVSSDNINIGGGVGSVHKNAPYVIQGYYGVMSLICLLMTTAFMNATANRDFQYGMYQFVFTSPIKKRDYFFGKFIGAATVAVIPMMGVSLGALIGPLMPWAQPERYGDIIWSGHIDGLLSFGIPNVLITGVLLYALALIFRNNIVSFVGAMLILVAYAISSGFMDDIDKEWLANLIDPFGFQPKSVLSKYMTVDEKNASSVALSGAFLYNRLLWMGLALVFLFFMYMRFSFNTKKERVKKEKKVKNEKQQPVFTAKAYIPSGAGKFSIAAFWKLVSFETKAVIKNPTFITIMLIGLINLITSLTSFTGGYGDKQFPVTYDVIGSIQGAFYMFLIGVITFYSGVLVWKERDSKISEIEDATPVKTGLLFTSKLAAMIITVALILGFTILVGIIAQTAYGYTRYELGVYFWSLMVLDLLSFSFLILLALLFHYLINNRYIAYFAFVAFIILSQFIWTVLEIGTLMVQFGGTPFMVYSDMNGYGPFIPGLFWFNIYWILFCIPLAMIIHSFYIRGKENAFGRRLKEARYTLAKNGMAFSVFIILFVVCGGFVYYNTLVLNTYDSHDEEEKQSVDYEKTYKKYENLPMPRIYKINYTIDIIPYERSVKANIEAWATNKSGKEIKEIHFTMPPISDSMLINIEGASIKLRDNRLGYRIYTLAKPMMPGDSMLMKFEAYRYTNGFENSVSFTQLTQNGTFFNNMDICPDFGYSSGYEITDKNKRIKFDLPKRIKMPKLDESNLEARKNTYISDDADWVEINTTISTAPDQIAVAPGSLTKSWEKDGKKYFSYKLEQQSLNFYSFISAKYEVARKKWNGIDLEVYYIKEHEYNVPNMLKSMEKSLEYYTKNYGPYYHKQCRIIEFPRYQSFAQAFPGSMPYSEGIGFITDLREVTKDDIDLVFYVVAHEMGHQYWAHQICGANMQGSEMMSEGFAQYSSLMVMEKEYGKDKMKKFLEYEMDGYLHGRSSEFEAERPLMRTEGQGYIHYQKASVVMYYLKEMIGEQNVNAALRSLIDSFAYRQPPYPTSISAVNAFRKATPDSLQYLIDDMFENITLFSNRVTEASYKKAGDEYEVTIKTVSEKFRADSLGTEKVQPVADYIDIAVFAKSEKSNNLGKPLAMQRVLVNKKDNNYSFRVKEEPYQVGIDPYNYLVDRLPDDNVKKLTETE
jgi:ABC-2 type transport system permease protein